MDLRFLDALYTGSGPMASVYLDASPTEDTAKEVELRWRGLREELAEQGADAETLRALDGAVGESTGLPGPQGEALFARGGRVLAAHTLSRPPRRNHASWLPVPDPLDLVADLEEAMPYVVVAADRLGADVAAYGRYGGLAEERSFSGGSLHVQKVRGGGMAHRRYQRRSEQLWDANAAEVAADVADAVAEVNAVAVFVGGDERALGKLRGHLDERTRGLLVDLPGGGRADADAMASLRDAVQRRLEETAVLFRDTVVAEFRDEVGRAGRAVEGLEATMAALRAGQVRTLLLQADRPVEKELWAALDDPRQVAADRGALTDPGEAVAGPASALLIRAAHAQGADLTLLPPADGESEDVGALLRFTMEA
ncbi:baeRF2 domain-containing protein [Marinitenerispora sediminis]|uniref:baeRF2 domain-containing protein n=1 Tax=Marinitenerispora sediminis TaxID=1931232 RepID=UPI000DF13BDD|nr:Vms1/Ankzf1 family peptidyl-tRNA hydrolase [Marinitenerispora sediminis]